MKPSAGIWYKRSHRTLSSIFVSNPALVLGFDLPFLIAASTSLKNAVAMSIQMSGVHLVTMIISLIFARKLSVWARSIVTVAISTGMMLLLRELIFLMFTDITNSIGLYIYLTAFNGLTFYQSLALNRRSRLLPVLKREGFHTLAFVLMMFAISFLREYFGSGTLWGIPISMPFKLTGILMPFSGFIILGFALAATRFFNRKLLGIAMYETYKRQHRYVINPKA